MKGWWIENKKYLYATQSREYGLYHNVLEPVILFFLRNELLREWNEVLNYVYNMYLL